jgi:DNA mismatch endonuclease (patch repair protein)
MIAQRQADTAPELAVRSALHRRGLRFWKHRAPIAGLRCKADVVFPRYRVAVFIDGCFWHGCSLHRSIPKANREWWREKIARNVARDRRNDELLKARGWMVVRVWEHDDPARAAERIEAVLRTRTSA